MADDRVDLLSRYGNVGVVWIGPDHTFRFQTVSSHGAHGVATGDEYCIEITTNYRYMLLSCVTAGLGLPPYSPPP